MTGPRPRNRGQRHERAWRGVLWTTGITDAAQQTRLLQAIRKTGIWTAVGSGLGFVASTFTNLTIYAASSQPFIQRLGQAAHDGGPGAAAAAGLTVAVAVASEFVDARKTSKQADEDRAAGKDPDADPLEKFKEYDEKIGEHDQAIATQSRKHAGLVSVTARAIRGLGRRITGTDQRVAALQAQVDAVKAEMAAQRHYFEGQLAQLGRQTEERFATQERRQRSELDARTSGLGSRIDAVTERVDRHDVGLGLAQTAHQNTSARLDQVEQAVSPPQSTALPPGAAARGQEALERARRARDQSRGTAPAPSPPAGPAPRPGQPFNQPPPAQPRPNRPRQ